MTWRTLESARDQAAHVEALERHVDDDAGDHGDDRARQQEAVVDRPLSAGLDIAESDRQVERGVEQRQAKQAVEQVQVVHLEEERCQHRPERDHER
jgi:hypothetical protein